MEVRWWWYYSTYRNSIHVLLVTRRVHPRDGSISISNRPNTGGVNQQKHCGHTTLQSHVPPARWQKRLLAPRLPGSQSLFLQELHTHALNNLGLRYSLQASCVISSCLTSIRTTKNEALSINKCVVCSSDNNASSYTCNTTTNHSSSSSFASGCVLSGTGLPPFPCDVERSSVSWEAHTHTRTHTRARARANHTPNTKVS